MGIMKRVAVIGVPGGGKTTFATELAERTGLPLIHLDYYYLAKSHDYRHDKEAWRECVKKLVQGQKWIIDGNYSSTYDIRLPSADTIIFFNLPMRVSMWRVLRRRLRYHNKTRQDMPENWREKANLGFLKYVFTFRKKHAGEIRQMLQNFKDKKVFTVNSAQEAEKLINKLAPH